MKIVQIHRKGSAETVALLEALLEKAKAGVIVGVALCYIAPDGFEDSLISGRYNSDSSRAAAAALRLSMQLADQHGEFANGKA